MATLLTTKRGGWLGLVVLLVATTVALAQLGGEKAGGKGADAAPVLMEYTQQEVQANAVVQTLNDLAKQRWEVFQIVPYWTLRNQNGENELAPKNYEVFARRPIAPK